MKTNARKGSAYILTIAVLLFVSLFSLLTIKALQNMIHFQRMEGIQLQAYYYNKEALDSSVAALLSVESIPDPLNPEITKDGYRFEQISWGPERIDGGKIEHSINLEKEISSADSTVSAIKDKQPYLGELKEWITVTADTEMKIRTGETISYKGQVMILCDNPEILVYKFGEH